MRWAWHGHGQNGSILRCQRQPQSGGSGGIIGGLADSVIKVGLVTKVGSVAVKVTMEVVAQVEIATSAM